MKLEFVEISADSDIPYKKFISNDLLHHKYILKKHIDKKESNESRTVFFDRDGVLIKEKHFLSDPSLIEFEEGALDLISKFKLCGWKIIIVTNQSGIHRGYFKWGDYERVTEKIIQTCGNNSQIDAIYANGLGPDILDNTWRKPNPEMIYAAHNDINLNLNSSIIIGDRLTDLLSGVRAGLKVVIHVKTGYGVKERDKIKKYIVTNNKNNFLNLSFLNEINKPIIKLVDNLGNILTDDYLFES